jgi:sarcosine/dimethylglycine N-methyltransferase
MSTPPKGIPALQGREEVKSRIAQAYYDSADAYEFYRRVWGGEDIHIGLYASPEDTVATASRRTLARAANRLAHRPAGSAVLDLGAGIGGTARYLAMNHQWRITALNISGVQNAEHAALNAEAGLDKQIAITGGKPYPSRPAPSMPPAPLTRSSTAPTRGRCWSRWRRSCDPEATSSSPTR